MSLFFMLVLLMFSILLLPLLLPLLLLLQFRLLVIVWLRKDTFDSGLERSSIG